MPKLARFVVGRLTGAPPEVPRRRDCFLCGKPMKADKATSTSRCLSCEASENILGWQGAPPESMMFGGAEIRFIDHGGPVDYPTPDSHGYKRGV
jgi:hypothetical protein